ncbi:DUF2530 domain-containing protein [Umezawaea sp. Da 62-37]|uniref:DUF2530 domain-containing protein n=1 Tax=Umezawaea sp. Da 62-37 TaxID=3075927 RepID=UPI0028F72249|nr:DUF2530 domain-containing protein [Umezawaea sp. Da 62-37]WNV82039.1 DUF2530 domain-containing protein [Umezawaea sp. Da 62-37]
MAEQSEHDSLPSPPPLPRRLSDPVPAIVGGTALWTIAFVVFLIIDPDDAVWTWASFTGAVLGVMGYGVFTWQRRAARRGSRGAQTGTQ